MTGQSPGNQLLSDENASSSRQTSLGIHSELRKDHLDSDDLTDRTILNDDPLAEDSDTQ